MNRNTLKKLLRIAVLPLLACIALTSCQVGEKPEPTELPTEVPTIEPEVPTAAPLSEEEAYDVAFALPVTAQSIDAVKPQTYAAVDALGRALSFKGDSYSSTEYSGTVGDRREGRYVGIFYSDWHEELSRSTSIRNVTQILSALSPEEAEAVKHDFKNKLWKGNTGYHFWDEPIYGYYSTADKYVLRKQAELLADAGVDCIIFDNTNGTFTWKESYTAIFETFTEAKKEGVNVPQIVFMLPFGAVDWAATQMRDLYKDIYSQGKYQDLWFYWKGKPLMMGYPGSLGSSGTDREIRKFFTWRENDGSYFMNKQGNSTSVGHWGWLSTYPQASYKNDDGTVEQITVGVAQNADYKRQVITAMSGYNVMGRSYTKGDYSYTYNKDGQKITVDKNIADSKFYGLNFQQQWDYALSLDPEFIFVTGWNEWVAIRMETWAGDTTLKNCLVDQCDTEHSRDVEPSNGVMKDYYYYQLCENIRRFKGVTPAESVNRKTTIDIGGKISQWNDIPAYNTYVHSTWVRSKQNGSRGYGNKVLKNNTARNDIVTAKVAYDDRFIYFYADTADVITPYTDEGWMRLFIDTGSSGDANWEGFEFVVNRVTPADENHTVLERSKGGWDWETVGEIEYYVRKNVIQLRIPREMLGMPQVGNPPVFGFKWCDNNLIGENEGNILNLYTDGEAAPGGRFTFVVK
ncbi:MAG: hypothetical protein IKI42_10785 [Clostridia bacterium]|nr:hypothetical protein [Clostridia bacterium]